jgi:hypothetical protein
MQSGDEITMWCWISNGWVKRDGSKRTYALNDRHLRLALHFCELCPAVSGETEEAIVVDGGFFAALLA